MKIPPRDGPPSSGGATGPPSSRSGGPVSTRMPGSPQSARGPVPSTPQIVGRSITDQIETVLAQFLSPAVRKSVIDCGIRQAKVDPLVAREGDLRRLLVEVKRGVKLFVRDQAQLDRCISELGELDHAAPAPREITIDVRNEEDVLRARSAGRELCIEHLVSDVLQTKIVTAISELGRNIVRYAGSGQVVVRSLTSPMRAIEIVAQDNGPGITNLPEILSGKYRSRHGMGAGLRGTKALMDAFDVKTAPGAGTTVTVRKYLG
ncbi:anti-sigma regulatory factor [Sorangium sp. So ce375]|uniref:anti-sigma regulatory factor n=1 Tax=Sorangium sp. So ce375 TaxID=3133306 RepID=UPI003F5BC1EE